MRANAINLLPTGALDLSTTQVTGAFPVAQDWGFAIQAVWTGVPVGNFTLEVSCDSGPIDGIVSPSAPPQNWSFYTGSTVAAGGGAGNWTWDVTQSAVRWVRLRYTSASGTGSLTSAQMNPKG